MQNHSKAQKELSTLRIPPHSLESEQAVLGALMLRPSALHEITDLLQPEMFYAKKHATVYQTMLELSAKSEPIDVLSVASKLKEKKQINKIKTIEIITTTNKSVVYRNKCENNNRTKLIKIKQ